MAKLWFPHKTCRRRPPSNVCGKDGTVRDDGIVVYVDVPTLGNKTCFYAVWNLYLAEEEACSILKESLTDACCRFADRQCAVCDQENGFVSQCHYYSLTGLESMIVLTRRISSFILLPIIFRRSPMNDWTKRWRYQVLVTIPALTLVQNHTPKAPVPPFKMKSYNRRAVSLQTTTTKRLPSQTTTRRLPRVASVRFLRLWFPWECFWLAFRTCWLWIKSSAGLNRPSGCRDSGNPLSWLYSGLLLRNMQPTKKEGYENPYRIMFGLENVN